MPEDVDIVHDSGMVETVVMTNDLKRTSAMAEFAGDAGIVTLLVSVIMFVGAGIVAITKQ